MLYDAPNGLNLYLLNCSVKMSRYTIAELTIVIDTVNWRNSLCCQYPADDIWIECVSLIVVTVIIKKLLCFISLDKFVS